MKPKGKSILSKIDLFGTSPNLNINNQSKYKTQCGGGLTILIGILTILVIVNSSIDLVTRQNPNVSLSEKILDSVGRVIPGPDKEMNFAVSLLGLTTIAGFTDPTIYTAKAAVYQSPPVTGDPLLIYELDVEICTAESAGILKGAIGQAWCIKKDTKNKDKLAIGSFKDSYIVFTLHPCQSGSGVACKTSTEITTILRNSLIGFHYTYIAIDPDNRDKPLEIKPETYIAGGLGYQSTGIRVPLKELQLITEQSFFITKSDEESKPAVQDLTVEQNSPRSDEFLSIYFNLGNRQTVYNRRYKSIEDVIAEVSGIMQGIFIIITVLFTPYLERKYYQSIINTVFSVGYKKKQNDSNQNNYAKGNDDHDGGNGRNDRENPNYWIQNNEQQESNFPTRKQVSNIQEAYNLDQNNQQITTNKASPKKSSRKLPSEHNYIEQQLNDPENQQFQISDSPRTESLNEIEDQETFNPHQKYTLQTKKNRNFKISAPSTISNDGGAQNKSKMHQQQLQKSKTQKIKLQLSFWEWLKASICCSKDALQKEKVLDAGTQLLEKQLNVYYLLTKLQEIDSLKLCLFTYEQRMLFENMSKPSFNLDDDEEGLKKIKFLGQSDCRHLMSDEQKLKLEEVYKNIYRKLVQKEDKSQIELNLLEMVNKQCKVRGGCQEQ